MRDDMAKVIVERPRRGGGGARKGRSLRFDQLPAHEGMRRQHARDPKELNENLAPLRRYLERQVGRPWNKIYAEIAERLRADNTVQQHVRDHLSNFVAVKPRRTNKRFYPGRGEPLWDQNLYVDPNDGLLKRTDMLPEVKARRRSPPKKEKKSERVALSSQRELRRIEGLWYEIALAPLPQPEYRSFVEQRKIPQKLYARSSPTVEMEMRVRRLVTPAVIDAVSGKAVPCGPEIDAPETWAEYRKRYPDGKHAVAKRSLSRRELRQHGLANEQREM